MEHSQPFDLSGQQLAAKAAVEEWFLTDPDERAPIFRLFGYAGTGKTTTIRATLADLDLTLGADVFFGAFTGKAAMVMRLAGLPARTIHSLIYKPVMPIKKECDEIAERWNAEQDPEEKKRLRQELNVAQKVRYVLKDNDEDSELYYARLLVLDECSMVNDDMLRDLQTFNVPLLVLGDPGQLPPIDGEGALTREKPNIQLTEIHRQASGNPIIDYATRARNGIYIPYMSHGASGHVSKDDLSDEQILEFDQIITGKNDTRKRLNQNIRKLKGFTTPYPEVGDKLICLKNDMDVPGGGLFNGMICFVLEVGMELDTSIEITISREIDGPETPPIKVRALRAHFDAYFDKEAINNVRWWDRLGANEFDFGYAITVHKAQGSQWNKVLMFDDKFFVWDRANRRRWLYTGVTRAIESITIAD